jgi:hypothetical protein
LLRAAQQSKNPDLIYLGQIYSDAERDAEAEAVPRRRFPWRELILHRYLVGRAHYVLGRLLLKVGKKKKERRGTAGVARFETG